MVKQHKSSWEDASKWYNAIVGKGGHYFHQQVIFPQLLQLIASRGDPCHFLDLACGQGVLSRTLSQDISYLGIDASPSLIEEAKRKNRNAQARFMLGDIEKPIELEVGRFDQGCILLALQNLRSPLGALQNMQRAIALGGTLFLVLNHPCFRIPRMSHWGEDPKKQLQYRRMDAYLSPQNIPIQIHPSQGGASKQVTAFHHPLSTYSHWLKKTGFTIDEIHEWTSDKTSQGAKAKMENRARREFPLFLTLVCSRRDAYQSN